MKDKSLLSGAEHSVTRLERLNLTDYQQRDVVTYEPGQIVEFHRVAKGAVRRGVQEKRFKSGEQWGVLRREEGAVIVGKDGFEKQLPLEQARNFSVFEREKTTLSIGDRIRFTKNVKHREQKFLNNDLRTVVGIDESKIIFNKGEIIRNGAYLHLDQGIAVTSHASQAKTVDPVIVSVPVRAFSQANEAQFYVSMSRARFTMHLFTDSKVALRDAVTRPSKRLSSWELVNLAREGEWDEAKEEAQKKLAEEVTRAKLTFAEVDALFRTGLDFRDEILTVANEVSADLLVLSTHGYTGWKHLLLGSDAEKILEHAPCPILVVGLKISEA